MTVQCNRCPVPWPWCDLLLGIKVICGVYPPPPCASTDLSVCGDARLTISLVLSAVFMVGSVKCKVGRDVVWFRLQRERGAGSCSW